MLVIQNHHEPHWLQPIPIHADRYVSHRPDIHRPIRVVIVIIAGKVGTLCRRIANRFGSDATAPLDVCQLLAAQVVLSACQTGF